MNRFTKTDNEFLHRVYETYHSDARVGRVQAGDLSRYIQRLERNLMAFAEFYNSGYCVCSCTKCGGILPSGRKQAKGYKCPREILNKKLNRKEKNARPKDR